MHTKDNKEDSYIKNNNVYFHNRYQGYLHTTDNNTSLHAKDNKDIFNTKNNKNYLLKKYKINHLE